MRKHSSFFKWGVAIGVLDPMLLEFTKFWVNSSLLWVCPIIPHFPEIHSRDFHRGQNDNRTASFYVLGGCFSCKPINPLFVLYWTLLGRILTTWSDDRCLIRRRPVDPWAKEPLSRDGVTAWLMVMNYRRSRLPILTPHGQNHRSVYRISHKR
jgi:hypothetical protein